MSLGVEVTDAFSYADMVNLQVSSTTGGVKNGGGTVSQRSVSAYPTLRITQGRFGLISSVVIESLAKSVNYLFTMIIDDDSGIFPNRIDLKNTDPALPNDANIIYVFNVNIEFARVSRLNGASNNRAKWFGSFFSNEVNDQQLFNIANVIVGTPLIGRELVVGKGNSHIQGMTVYRDDGGVFTDITNSLKFGVDNVIATDVGTTASINLTSAPATIDGVTPTSGVTRVLVKNGSTANPGTTSVDNGVYIWNGSGSAMTRASDFAATDVFSHLTFLALLVAQQITDHIGNWTQQHLLLPLLLLVQPLLDLQRTLLTFFHLHRQIMMLCT